MTGMDYRQYDNAFRRFHGVDALVELAPDLTPYRFGFNNPVYWSDPTGLFESWQQAIGYMLSHGLSGRIHGSEGEYWSASGTGNETQNMTMIAGNVFTTFGELLSSVTVSNGGGNSSSGLGSFSDAGFGSPSGSGFGYGGVNNGGGSANMNTSYYGNYLGPGSDIIHPNVMRYTLSVKPIDIIDLAAFYHDIAYFEAGVGGVDGALNSIKVIEADKMLARQASIVMFLYWLGATDPITNKPISFKTYTWAKGVFILFGSISTYKQYQVNQYYNSIIPH